MSSSLGFTLGDRIGKGSFATVYKGRLNSTRAAVAVKVVHRAHLKRDKRLLDNFEAEMAILKQIKHPHVVLLNDVAQTEADFYLVMEYCSLGDLSYFIRKRTQLTRNLPLVASMYEKYPASAIGGLHETVVRHFITQLSAALKFLRKFDLVHRDIKPQNMLLMPPFADPEAATAAGILGLWELPVLKVADFGFARFLPSTSMAETLCGSPLYMAPEILHYEKYNAKADLWSVGAVVYEMITTKPPFPASNHMDLIKKIDEAKDKIVFPVGVSISNDLMALIRGLLKRSPSERMGFDEFFTHPVLEIEAEQHGLDMSSLDENMYISEYLKTTTAKKDDEVQYGANPFSSSEESLGELNTLVTKLSTAGGQIGTPVDTPPATPPATSSGSASASNSRKDLGNTIDEYVVVEKRTVEVNVLADDLQKKPEMRQRRLSSISYGTSPTNALAQALLKSSARLFGARVDSGTLQIPAPSSVPSNMDLSAAFSRLRSPSGSHDTLEDKLIHNLDRLNRMGRVVSIFAELKQSKILPDDDSQDPTYQDILAQEALALYLKALSLFARAMENAAKWWKEHDNEQSTPKLLTDLVQSIRTQFNDCIDKAEATRRCILNGQADRAAASLASVERLLFERALDLARSAAAQELADDVTACELNYATALWMLRAINEHDQEGIEDNLNADDRELVDRLSNKVQQRILAIRRRIESTASLSPTHTP